ncbi:hypothetical protein QYG89_01690 [Bacillus sp. B190/17]|uniref:Uncharacterized protein n=1 Tax=Bacillus lumedeiriae TaxID=3058829 RepID=A0ABW8I5A3_9BACI
MESIIIAIIVGLISLMTGRLKGDKKEKRQPSAQPGKPFSSSASDVYKQAKKQKNSQVKKSRTENKEEYEAKKTAAAKSEQSMGRLSRYQVDNETIQRASSPAPRLDIEADDLAKAVILSEILAPPKALRRK